MGERTIGKSSPSRRTGNGRPRKHPLCECKCRFSEHIVTIGDRIPFPNVPMQKQIGQNWFHEAETNFEDFAIPRPDWSHYSSLLEFIG
jgi:hypothetical protein